MKIFRTVLLLVAFIPTQAQTKTYSRNIRLNQIGYYPAAPKEAAWVGEKLPDFLVVSAAGSDTVFRGKLSVPILNPISQKQSQIADFSALRKPGRYLLMVPGGGNSYPFEIGEHVFRPAALAALKSFYFQRASVDLLRYYAGLHQRAAGHPDTAIMVHASAASAGRPEGTIISSPRGWYDAGDYNKYIVNSGISVGTMLLLYETYPAYFSGFGANIPESGNGLPDLLNEVLWNLQWMLSMQDPGDGGVYHKLTNAKFDGMMVMPADAVTQRYVVQKSITATLDFAAVMAQAARVFKNFEPQTHALSAICLAAAEKAWGWARANPDSYYDQNALNEKFDPDISTGAYGDKDARDEWIWAGTELYISTKKEEYYPGAALFPATGSIAAAPHLQTWNNVFRMAYYSLLLHQAALTPLAKNDVKKLRVSVLSFADSLLAGRDQQPFHTVMGKTAKDFMWGSSGHAANQGLALLQAYQLTHDKRYLAGALSNLDYLFGLNAVGYCFLTGFGSMQVLNIHHRPSEADGIAAPVPGLLSGGTNPGRQDKCQGYPSTFADECFMDSSCSYSTNEIAINWNAPILYLLSALEALQGDW